MSKPGVQFSRTDPSLQDYYDACAEESGDDSNGTGSESDQDSANYWRSTRRSPLRGRARLKLYQRDSVQKLLREQGYFASRGHDAEIAATFLARPLVIGSGAPREGMSYSKQLDRTCANGSEYVPTMEERLIFDSLCALRQSPSESFVASGGWKGTGNCGSPVTWVWGREEMNSSSVEGISLSVRAFVEAMLAGSNDVSRAEWQLQSISSCMRKEELSVMEDVFTDYSATTSGDEALLLASHLVLHRLCGIVRDIVRDVSNLALTLLEDEERHQKQNNSSGFTQKKRIQITKSVEGVLVPLRRCIHIMEQACQLVERREGESDEENDMDSIARASGLMDYLIVRMSALQDSCTMDLYRFYMTTLVFCSWPYVQLMTSAIFGFVTKIDSDAWRSRVPRIFRLSFSHIRVGESHRRGQKAAILPTDILSHVFLCVGHCRPEGQQWKCEGGDQWRGQLLNRARRRAAFESMISARSYILHSFVAFAQQKTLKGLRRKRVADHRVASSEATPEDWELCRLENMRPRVEGTIVDVLPLALHIGDVDGATHVGALPMRWKICVENSGTHQNIVLSSCDELGKGEDVGQLQLWLHTLIPAARWVTVSLLVPIAQVVHRLQERTLTELLLTAAETPCLSIGGITGVFDGSQRSSKAPIDEGVSCVGELPETASVSTVQVKSDMTDLSGGRASFRDYMSLLVDIALCRDTERVVHKFLHRLLGESHWWYRCGAAEYACSGTSSSFISAAFADAVKDHPLGQFVRLSVAPKLGKADDDTEGVSGEECQVEMLRTFSAFELVFTLPYDVEVILVPHSLSLEWDEDGGVQEVYTSSFWERRQCNDDSSRRRTESTNVEGGRPRDCWSYCFGYLCSLYYAQMSLREQRKRLQRQDADEHSSATASADGLSSHHHRAVRIVRALEVPFFELAFAVDCLLSFTRNVVTVVVCELEKLAKVGSTTSCIALCQSLDALLLRLLVVCFPEGERSVCTVASSAETSITNSVSALLVIALDPASLPIRRVVSQTRSAVEALVAVVRALPMSSVIRKHTKPLLVLLTFNRFYAVCRLRQPFPDFPIPSSAILFAFTCSFSPAAFCLTAANSNASYTGHSGFHLMVRDTSPVVESTEGENGDEELKMEDGDEEGAEEEHVGSQSCLGGLVGWGSEDSTILLRNDASEFSPGELEELGRMEFADTDYYNCVQASQGEDGKEGSYTDSVCAGSRIHSSRSVISGSGRASVTHDAFRSKTATRGDSSRRCTLTQLLPAVGRVGGADAVADAVLQQQQLHVADCGLRDTLLVECFLNLTHLYMQHNEVESLEGLELLAQLRVLIFHHNAVASLRPISVLPVLSFIDARSNKIQEINPTEDLPCDSLKYLAILDNPCSSDDGSVHREGIFQACPKLTALDDVPRDSAVELGRDRDGDEGSEVSSDDTGEWKGNPSGSRSQRCCDKNLSSRMHLYRSLRMGEPLRVSVPSLEPLPTGSGANLDEGRPTTTTDRLCEQLKHRSTAVRRMAQHHALEKTGGSGLEWDFENEANESSSAEQDGGEGKNLRPPSSHLPPALPPELEQERATKVRLYDDIRFSLQADDSRLRQLAEVVWDDVDKVLSTRQALVKHRRRRMEAAHEQPSDAYTKSLEILQQESRESNLDKYRKRPTEVRTLSRLCSQYSLIEESSSRTVRLLSLVGGLQPHCGRLVRERNKMKTECFEAVGVSDDGATDLCYCTESISLLSRADIEAITRLDEHVGGGDGDENAFGPRFEGPHSRLKTCVAALPMLLQTEALVLRRHEQQFRHHMKELVDLTECIMLLCDGSLRQHTAAAVGQPAEETPRSRRAEGAALHRMLHRAEELERFVRAAAVERVRSAQRMLLVAATVDQRSKLCRKATTQPPKTRK